MSTGYLTGVKYIELTQGKVAIVDDWIAPLVSQYKWCFGRGKKNGYAWRGRRKGESGTSSLIGMHRFIWESVEGEVPPGLVVDHKNGYKLDNRLFNLRPVDRRLNATNTEDYRMGLVSSIYPGVCWYPNYSKWISQIRINRKRYTLGYYVLEEDASAAYWQALNNWEERGELPNKRRNL